MAAPKTAFVAGAAVAAVPNELENKATKVAI